MGRRHESAIPGKFDPDARGASGGKYSWPGANPGEDAGLKGGYDVGPGGEDGLWDGLGDGLSRLLPEPPDGVEAGLGVGDVTTANGVLGHWVDFTASDLTSEQATGVVATTTTPTRPRVIRVTTAPATTRR
jgi:hypothetical protein